MGSGKIVIRKKGVKTFKLRLTSAALKQLKQKRKLRANLVETGKFGRSTQTHTVVVTIKP